MRRDETARSPLSPRCARMGWIALCFTLALSGSPGALAAGAPDSPPADGRGKGDGSALVTPTTAPLVHRRIHYVGDFWTSFANDGTFGSQHGDLGCDPRDRQTLGITWTPSEEIPGGSRVDYLYMGSLWIGGIVGTDTTVTMSITSGSAGVNEFNGFTPVESGLPPGYSNVCGSGPNKHLEQTYWCVYYDTMIPQFQDGVDSRLHLPLGLEITQVSHQGSDNFSRRFVIYDLQIKNISNHPIDNMYMGVFMDNDCWYYLQTSSENKADDDISGILTTWPNPRNPVYTDTLNTSWAADNNGDPFENGPFPRVSARGAVGIRMLRAPAGARLSFNWWAPNFAGASFDWSPHKSTDTRSLGTGGTGDPVGDRNSYWYMANGEIDYGQMFSAVDFTAQGWRKPPQRGFDCNIAGGLDTRGVVAMGPVTRVNPGETVPFTFALVAGANVHRFPDNRFDCHNPQAYLNRMDFSDFAKNAWWAGFVFDNYGVDTDVDGYAGKYYPQIGSDTNKVYYTGDGCPDFSGPRPPPCPQAVIAECSGAHCDTVARDMRISSSPGQLRLWWTGRRTELELNSLLGARDFEGYRVYVSARTSKDDIPSPEQYSLIASWDVVDYRRFTYDDHLEEWLISSTPYTEEQWYAKFKDQTNPFKGPKAYVAPSFERAYRYTDLDTLGHPVERYAYFAAQDYNQGNEYQQGSQTVQNRIQKIAELDSIIVYDTLQFGEYELTLDSLLPSKVYFISVTAYNYGDPGNNLEPQECPPGGGNTIVGVPIYSSDTIQALWNSEGAKSDSIRVIVYPNPYKSAFTDASGHRSSYVDQGYERAGGGGSEDRERRIHFINLPDSARIRIYTLDGDLVRELDHPDKHLSEYSSKISWDLISRNTQAVESGIYIYRVDFPLYTHMEPQVGKIVIIK